MLSLNNLFNYANYIIRKKYLKPENISTTTLSKSNVREPQTIQLYPSKSLSKYC
jgi:hypothetical protein